MIDGIDIPRELFGRMVVQSHVMTKEESTAWLKFVADFAPEGLFEHFTWVPDGEVN